MKNLFKTTPEMVKANPAESVTLVAVAAATAGLPFAVWGLVVVGKKIVAKVKASKDAKNVEEVEEVEVI